MAKTIDLFVRITESDDDLDADTVPAQTVIEKSFTGLTKKVWIQDTINNATRTLWDATASPLTSFSVMAIWATGEIEVELTCNNGDANEVIWTEKLVAGVPKLLGSDDSRYNPGALTGTADVIDLIRAKNSAATDVEVYLLLAV